MQSSLPGGSVAEVDVVEVGPRDGLQNEAVSVSTADKVALITRLVDAGVRRVEAVSFVNPKRVPQMADAEGVLAGVPRRPGVSYIGLVLNERGLTRAVEAGRQGAGVDEVNVVVLASETFSRRNQGADVDEAVSAWLRIADAAHEAGLRASVTLSAAFGCPYEGDVPPARVLELVRRCLAGHPDEICIADTIGAGVPAQVRHLVGAAVAEADGVPVRGHFHNTRNAGYANALAALDAGARSLDASVGGFGGCPFAPRATGNIATEDLVWQLDRSGVSTGVSAPAVADAGVRLAERLGHAAPGLVGRAGVFPPPAATG